MRKSGKRWALPSACAKSASVSWARPRIKSTKLCFCMKQCGKCLDAGMTKEGAYGTRSRACGVLGLVCIRR